MQANENNLQLNFEQLSIDHLNLNLNLNLNFKPELNTFNHHIDEGVKVLFSLFTEYENIIKNPQRNKDISRILESTTKLLNSHPDFNKNFWTAFKCKIMETSSLNKIYDHILPNLQRTYIDKNLPVDVTSKAFDAINNALMDVRFHYTYFSRQKKDLMYNIVIGSEEFRRLISTREGVVSSNGDLSKYPYPSYPSVFSSLALYPGKYTASFGFGLEVRFGEVEWSKEKTNSSEKEYWTDLEKILMSPSFYHFNGSLGSYTPSSGRYGFNSLFRGGIPDETLSRFLEQDLKIFLKYYTRNVIETGYMQLDKVEDYLKVDAKKNVQNKIAQAIKLNLFSETILKKIVVQYNAFVKRKLNEYEIDTGNAEKNKQNIHEMNIIITGHRSVLIGNDQLSDNPDYKTITDFSKKHALKYQISRRQVENPPTH